MVYEQGQGNQSLRLRVAQLEQLETVPAVVVLAPAASVPTTAAQVPSAAAYVLAVAPPDAEAQSAKLASELVAHAVTGAAEAATLISDKSATPVTTQKAAVTKKAAMAAAAAGVTVESSHQSSQQELKEANAELQEPKGAKAESQQRCNESNQQHQ